MSAANTESCGECDRGRVPTWGGEGNQTGDEPCKRCDGTGTVAIVEPCGKEEMTCIMVNRLVHNWICDGCPTGEDSAEASREEADRIVRYLDRRISQWKKSKEK